MFKSHRPEFKDGEQLRDFIYVEDVARYVIGLIESDRTMVNGQRAMNGLYNLGTGKARTFNDLANATFAAMGKEPVIEYIDMPEDIRDKYQYFTEADMNKLRNAGYKEGFYSLEDGCENLCKEFFS